MTQEHPITPPPELLNQWADAWRQNKPGSEMLVDVATQAARWGADQELEACCEWFMYTHPDDSNLGALRAARRPKPPSLKQQALEALQRAEEGWRPIPDDCDTIRRALEALPDD